MGVLLGGSLLLVTPSSSSSFGQQPLQLTTGTCLPFQTNQWRPGQNLAGSHNPIMLSSSEESMLSGDNGKSPQSPSMNSDDESNMEGSLLQSCGGGSGSRPYSCSYPACSKFFSSKYKLLRHELIHSQEKRHHCPLCHKKFHRKDHLNNHLKVHERSKVRLECLLCGCIFAKKWTYEKHLALHERDQALDPEARSQLLAALEARGMGDEEEEDDEDEDEKEDSMWPTRLENETVDEPLMLQPEPGPAPGPVQMQHNAKKQPLNQKAAHPCEVCGKVFSASKDLRRHLQTHLGIKPNLCPYCPKKFTRKDHVRRHISTVHADYNDVVNGIRGGSGAGKQASSADMQIMAQ